VRFLSLFTSFAYFFEGQQIALSHFHLREYVTSNDRGSLIGANKEGIVSLPGYLSIQLLGLSAGTLILPPTPSFYTRRHAAFFGGPKTGFAHIDKRRHSDPMTLPQKEKNFDISAPRQTGKTVTELCAFAILWWSLLGFVRMLGVDGWGQGQGGVSRRMVRTLSPFSSTFWDCAC
jgi:phosphatidylinositol glycan class W